MVSTPYSSDMGRQSYANIVGGDERKLKTGIVRGNEDAGNTCRNE